MWQYVAKIPCVNFFVQGPWDLGPTVGPLTLVTSYTTKEEVGLAPRPCAFEIPHGIFATYCHIRRHGVFLNFHYRILS